MAREFTRCVPADIDGETGLYPTFHWSIAQSIIDDDDSLLSADSTRSPLDPASRIRRPHNACAGELENERVLVLPRIRYQFAQFTMEEVMDGVESGVFAADNSRRNIFFRKVVIVGGSYDLRDQHLTAFARQNSHQLLARAIEAERRGELTNRLPGCVGLLIGFLLAAGIAWVHHMCIPVFAGAVTLFTMTVGSLLLSLTSFLLFDRWLDALPFLLCFWALEVYFQDPIRWAARKVVPGL